jgi:hypothetical protein
VVAGLVLHDPKPPTKMFIERMYIPRGAAITPANFWQMVAYSDEVKHMVVKGGASK